MNNIIKNRRNAVCVWLDYKKAFDSIPHSWLLKSLELAKVPPEIIRAIRTLTETWATSAQLQTEAELIETEEIKYECSISQDDALSVIPFALSVNPASFLLEKVEGYKIKKTSKQINHAFFVDDLKLFVESMNIMKLLLDIITTYSRDIGLKFGEDKCAYALIIRGKRKSGNGPIEINGSKVRELKDEEEYKYLGQDESVGYNGPLNKERIVKEYKKRVRKI